MLHEHLKMEKARDPLPVCVEGTLAEHVRIREGLGVALGQQMVSVCASTQMGVLGRRTEREWKGAW